MPSPVAHSLVAVALHRRLPLPWPGGARCCLLPVLLGAANLPDVDLLVGLATGNANRFHHQVTHSLVFCAVAVVVLAVVGNRVWPLGLKRWLAVHGILLGSHLVLDALTADTAAPFGQPLLWPFWHGYLHSPVTLFLDVRRIGARDEFFSSLLTLHNLKAVVWETVLLAPLVVLAGRGRGQGAGERKERARTWLWE